MESINDIIGGNIRRMRRERGLLQKELAGFLFVCAENISKWELGKVAPSADNLARLADVFGCSMDALFGRISVNE